MTDTTPAAVERFDYCIHESEMLPFDTGEFVKFTDYAALSAQLEASQSEDLVCGELYREAVRQCDDLRHQHSVAHAQGKADGLREAMMHHTKTATRIDERCEGYASPATFESLHRQKAAWHRAEAQQILALIPADTPKRIPCDVCSGQGFEGLHDCRECNGNGAIPADTPVAEVTSITPREASLIAARIERFGPEHDRALLGWGLPDNCIAVFEGGNITHYLPLLSDRALAADTPAAKVTVQEAAKVVADYIDSDMVEVNRMIDAMKRVSMDTPARHWLSQVIRAIAGGRDD